MSIRLVLISHLFVALAVAICLLAGGCSKPEKSAAEMDASELLALFQERQHVDARNFVEMDLGRFRVTHKLEGSDGQLYVQFHVYGILPQDRLARLSQLWPQYEKRARDAIISLAQRTETEHLSDPSLTFFKEEVSAAVNKVLQERLLIDVAFSDCSTDREAGVPWSAPSEAKPSGGGHGGGHGGH